MKTLLNILRTIGHYLGLIWTKLILGIFYFTFFALAALMVKIFSDPLQMKSTKTSTWMPWTTAGKDWFQPF